MHQVHEEHVPKGERIKHIFRPSMLSQSVHIALGGEPLLTMVVVERPDPHRPQKRHPVVMFVPPWMIVPESGDPKPRPISIA